MAPKAVSKKPAGRGRASSGGKGKGKPQVKKPAGQARGGGKVMKRPAGLQVMKRPAGLGEGGGGGGQRVLKKPASSGDYDWGRSRVYSYGLVSVNAGNPWFGGRINKDSDNADLGSIQVDHRPVEFQGPGGGYWKLIGQQNIWQKVDHFKKF